jgi:hypothetical protein
MSILDAICAPKWPAICVISSKYPPNAPGAGVGIPIFPSTKSRSRVSGHAINPAVFGAKQRFFGQKRALNGLKTGHTCSSQKLITYSFITAYEHWLAQKACAKEVGGVGGKDFPLPIKGFVPISPYLPVCAKDEEFSAIGGTRWSVISNCRSSPCTELSLHAKGWPHVSRTRFRLRVNRSALNPTAVGAAEAGWSWRNPDSLPLRRDG